MALIKLRPTLRFGVADGNGFHVFAHDDSYAYDSAGRHPLPYLGVNGDGWETDDVRLDQDPKLWLYLDSNGEPYWNTSTDTEVKADEMLAKAIDHATRHRILDGDYQRQEQPCR